MGRKRGSIISAGLPVGREQDKTKSRFKNQFVGFMSKTRIEGAAPALKFLDFKRGERNTVLAGITQFGLKFCTLLNPVIDKEDFSSPFSVEETTFLLDHIANQLPGEAKLVRLVLSSIKKGITTPDDLSHAVKSYDSSWTKNEVIAMRVGAVSRMSELGLLERHKDGVKVTYYLSRLGEQYLGKLTGAKEGGDARIAPAVSEIRGTEEGR
jgi:hypothetical protein